jgi:hypothetical protein
MSFFVSRKTWMARPSQAMTGEVVAFRRDVTI